MVSSNIPSLVALAIWLSTSKRNGDREAANKRPGLPSLCVRMVTATSAVANGTSCGAAQPGRPVHVRWVIAALDKPEQSIVSCFDKLGIRMPSKAGPFTFTELQTITCLSRGEIRECINRGIISARAGVGQGNHRAYSKWNLVEGVIAAALLRHIRAGSVEELMIRLRSHLKANQIDPEIYSSAPDRLDFAFELHFPPRINLDGKADFAVGEDAGENAFLIATSSGKKPHNDRSLKSDTPSEAFCRLPIELEKAVMFINYMVERKL